MRKIHSLGLVGAVALVLAAVVAPAANGAVTRVETDQFSGEASTKGDVSSFEAIGTGTVASLRLNATQILKPALDALKPVLDTVAATPVGDLLKATDAPAKTAVTTLNGLLGSLLGQGSVVLPTLEPSQTVKDVVNRLEDADLLRINIGNAIAKNTGTAANFTSESLAQGGTIEVLPAFRGLG